MVKVSVIVPIYGVEAYIERCARSLFEQTLEDMQFIFVDDKTPDKSVEVLQRVIEDYPERKANILIVKHEENQGSCAARKTAIRYAEGEFVAHCDSDDWVDLDLYQKLYEKAKQDESDVVVCSFIETDCQHLSIPISVFPAAKDGVLTNRLSCWENEGSLCNKLFKRELYNYDITFPVADMGEDMCLVYQLIFYCKKISYVPEVHYYIYKNPLSITRTPTKENILKNFNGACANCRIVEKFYLQHGLNDKETSKAVIRLKYSKREILRPLIAEYEYYKLWCETFPEIDKSIFKSNALTLREKIKSLLIRFKIFPFPWSK